MDCIDLFKRAAMALQTDPRYVILDQARKANDKDEELQNLLVQLSDAGIVALVLADLVVQIHAGQIELADQVLQLLILIVCLWGSCPALFLSRCGSRPLKNCSPL